MSKRKLAMVPVREPNGRLLRSVETAIDAQPPSVARRLRDAACARMAAPEWGTELGRLFLAGKIGPKLYETGKRWASLVEAYHAATGAPLEAPPATAFFKHPSKRSPDPDTEAGQRLAKREAAIVTAAHEALAVLFSSGGPKLRAVRSVCERGEACRDLPSLMLGLGWLAQHWMIIDLAQRRLTGKKSNVRKPV